MEDWGYGEMYRFDDLEDAALISLASTEDVDLPFAADRPRPSPRPTVSRQRRARRRALSARGAFAPGRKHAILAAGAGAIHAYVWLRGKTFVRAPCTYILNGCLPPDVLSVGCGAYYYQGRCVAYSREFAITGRAA